MSALEVLPPGQLSLFELAAIANEEHALALASGLSMVEHAIRAGEALTAAKAQLRHGEWLPWLSDNFGGGERTARRYMLVASNRTRVADLKEPSLRKALAAIAGLDGDAHVANNSGDSEWFTPREYIAAAREVMGMIGLDPATTPEANEVVQADEFFTAGDDGLRHPWAGKVWMNPPYARPLIDNFCAKLAEDYANGDVTEAIVLVNNATETGWFHALAEVASAICFPRQRIKFWHPDKESCQPLQGQAVIYLGSDRLEFRRVFVQFGFTVTL